MPLLGSDEAGQGSIPTGAGQKPQGTPGGPFPGFGGAPPSVGTANAAGTSGLAAQSNHEHQGVHSLNGGFGDLTAPFFTNGITTGAVQLSTLASGPFSEGALAWVATVGAYFRLQQTALTVDNITVVAATGKGGFQWVRTAWLNPVWQAQTAWTVNTSTGSDEAAGTGGAPLKTLSEVARRLAFATLTATTVTLVGNTATTDLPVWSFNGGVFSLSIVATPTTLFTGGVTTAVNVAVAPTTTENDLTDTSIPVSFTASGLLANGVLFSFTNGAAGRTCWAVKDKGAKTIRIGQPHTNFGGNATFANTDTYVAQQLPTVHQMRFTGLLSANAVFCQNLLFPAGYVADEQCYYFQTCWFTSASVSSNVFEGCAFQGSGSLEGAGNNTNGGAILNGCTWRGSGSSTFQFYGSPGCQANFTSTLQGVWWSSINGSFIVAQGDVLGYDVTTAGGFLQASYWSEILLTTAVGGSNNAALASVSRMGQIAHTSNPCWVAGSSTAANPIFVSGTGGSPLTVAAESAGGGVVNTSQNGIYPTS